MGIFVKDNNINTGVVGSQGSSAQSVNVQNSTVDISNIERGNSDISNTSQVSTVDLGDLINEGGSTAADVANSTITNGNTNIGEINQTSSQTSNQNMQNSNTNTENINQQSESASKQTINNDQTKNDNVNQETGSASSKSASSGGQGGGTSSQPTGTASKPAGSSSSGSKSSSQGSESASAKSGSMSVQGKQGVQGQKTGEAKGKSSTINSTTSNKIIDSSGNISRTGATISNQKSISTKTTAIQGNTNLAHSNTGAKLGRGVRFFVKEIINTVESIKATEAVLATTVMSAAGRILEKVFVDGLVGYAVAGVMDLIGEDDIANDLRKFAARNLVGEANTWFYENTELGKHINELSAIKYDSELAKKIESFSETAIKIAAATAISAVPGGVFILAAVGALEGMGGAAESAYQNALAKGEEDLTLGLLSNLGILGSGALDAVSWIFNAKLGQGLMNLAGDISELGIKEIGKNLAKQVFSKETLNSILKPSNLIMNGGQSALQSGGKAGLIFSKYMNGEKVTLSDWADLAATFGFYFVMNTLEDTMRDMVSGYKKISITKKQYDIPDKIYADNLFKNKSRNGTYGVDQGALDNFIIHQRLNNDWLDDPLMFRNFVCEKYPDYTPEKVDELINNILNSDIVSEKSRNLIIEYFTKNSATYIEAVQKYSKSFIPIPDPIYFDKLMLKYGETGLGLNGNEVAEFLTRINEDGACSYAAQANGIAAFFADKPELFKEKFGFDLYIEINGKQVINSPELLADLYTYANTKANVPEAKLFDIVDGKLKVLSTNATDQIYLSNRVGTRDDIIRSYLKSKSPDFDFVDYMESYGTNKSLLRLGVFKDSKEVNPTDLRDRIKGLLDDDYNVQLGIYQSKNLKFTFKNPDDTINVTTNEWSEGGGHAVFVTDITENEVIISSWGEKLKLSLDEFVNNNFNLIWSKIKI